MKNLLITLVIVFIVSSCQNSTVKKVRQGEPDIYEVTNEDQEMNYAIIKAKKSFDEFVNALTKPTESQTGFSVKVPFPIENGNEHIWISDVQLDSGKMIGFVGNVPEKVKNLTIGQKITIDKDNISDWMYLDSNVLVGGFTIRVLYSRMTDAEKRQFESENQIIIK
jgi:uncharacterized protein YegJ (DUF2314 family)